VIEALTAEAFGTTIEGWRRISWTLLLKLVALLALWLLFFSPAHRTPVTPDAVEALFSVDAVAEPGKSLAEGITHD
jgi:hypothetical protein